MHCFQEFCPKRDALFSKNNISNKVFATKNFIKDTSHKMKVFVADLNEDGCRARVQSLEKLGGRAGFCAGALAQAGQEWPGSEHVEFGWRSAGLQR